MMWDDKQRRCYQRIIYGLEAHKENRLRFMTLTSVPEQKCSISKAFNNLNRDIKDLTPNKLIKNNYLTRRQCCFYYGKENLDKNFMFHFIRVKTGEGYMGVFHILFFGQFIPYQWLFDTWKRLLDINYLSKRGVSLNQCKENIYNKKKLATYCVSQYVAGQNLYIKFYCSFTWIFKGFWNEYKTTKLHYNTWRCRNAEYGGEYTGYYHHNGLINLWNEHGFFYMSFIQCINFKIMKHNKIDRFKQITLF